LQVIFSVAQSVFFQQAVDHLSFDIKTSGLLSGSIYAPAAQSFSSNSIVTTNFFPGQWLSLRDLISK
jgi:hypothetical protein